MSDAIIGRIDEMGHRIDELENSIGELMAQVRAVAGDRRALRLRHVARWLHLGTPRRHAMHPQAGIEEEPAAATEGAEGAEGGAKAEQPTAGS